MAPFTRHVLRASYVEGMSGGKVLWPRIKAVKDEAGVQRINTVHSDRKIFGCCRTWDTKKLCGRGREEAPDLVVAIVGR